MPLNTARSNPSIVLETLRKNVSAGLDMVVPMTLKLNELKREDRMVKAKAHFENLKLEQKKEEFNFEVKKATDENLRIILKNEADAKFNLKKERVRVLEGILDRGKDVGMPSEKRTKAMGEIREILGLDPIEGTLKGFPGELKEPKLYETTEGLLPTEKAIGKRKPKTEKAPTLKSVAPGHTIISASGKVIYTAPTEKKAALKAVSPGQTIIDQTGKVIYTAPAKLLTPSAQLTKMELDAWDRIYKGTGTLNDRKITGTDKDPAWNNAVKFTMSDPGTGFLDLAGKIEVTMEVYKLLKGRRGDVMKPKKGTAEDYISGVLGQ